MKLNTKTRIVRSLGALMLAAPLFVALLAPAQLEAQKKFTTSSVGGGGMAASVNSQPMANSTLPVYGGYGEASADSTVVPGMFSAVRMTSMTSGLTDSDLLGSESTSTAEGVDVMSGLITARGVTAVAASWAGSRSAGSDGEGSSVSGLVVNGVDYGDATPAPNTKISLGNGNYVILNEQVVAGNGRTGSSITVNMIHLVTKDASGTRVEIVVGSASAQVTM